jgi:hypothetical protein
VNLIRRGAETLVQQWDRDSVRYVRTATRTGVIGVGVGDKRSLHWTPRIEEYIGFGAIEPQLSVY